jgi:molybdopterin/thiamine biosynthesis adenylyltransferase
MITSDREIYLVSEIIRIPEEEVISRSLTEIIIENFTLVRALKRASLTGTSIGFAHSHPEGSVQFSKKDDRVDTDILHTVINRLRGNAAYLSLIWSDDRFINGRKWNKNGVQRNLDTVIEVGEWLHITEIGSGNSDDLRPYQRQAEVIGGLLQSQLSSRRTAVVGVGGTGSALAMQLARLGVGEIILFDPDVVDRSNLSRLHGASTSDIGLPKVAVMERAIRSIGLGTYVRGVQSDIASRDAATELATCDFAFGCTDDEFGRSVLSRAAYAFLLPTIDMAVKIIVGDAGQVASIVGRVTTLLPTEACLDCRGRITAAGANADMYRRYNPEEAERLERDGYLTGIETTAPAVVTFTTSVASFALNEFVHRFAQLYGDERKASEILIFFEQDRIRRNRPAKRDGCYCNDPDFRGSGFEQPLLGMNLPC